MYCPNKEPITISNSWYIGKIIMILTSQYTQFTVINCFRLIKSKIGPDINSDVDPVIAKTINIVIN